MRTRLRQHINDKQANYRTNWIKSLKKHNLLPTIHEVAKVPRESIDHWERFWIQYFRSAGAKLTNLTNGGKAPLLGRSLTEEHRKKIGEANRGKKRSAEFCADVTRRNKTRKLSEKEKNRLRTVFLGRKHTEESKRKMSDALGGRKRSPEFCKRNGDIHRGKKASQETREKLSKAQKGRPAWNKGKVGISDETRDKLSRVHKGRKHSEEHKRKMREAWAKRKSVGYVAPP